MRKNRLDPDRCFDAPPRILLVDPVLHGLAGYVTFVEIKFVFTFTVQMTFCSNNFCLNTICSPKFWKLQET